MADLKQKARSRKHYLANRDKCLEQSRRWQKEHPGAFLEHQRRYRARHPEKVKAAARRQRGTPEPTRPRPEICERPNCTRPATVADHDHTTGKFRGWLCMQCNTGLGKLGDTIEGLCFAITYLRRAK